MSLTKAYHHSGVYLGEGNQKIKEAHMQIKIDLPLSSIFMEGDAQDYKTAESFLRQLELSVHHAQKSLKQMKEMSDEVGETCYSVSVRVQDVEYYDEENRIGNAARAYVEINCD